MVQIRDKYLNARGGTSKVVNVSCTNCGKRIFIYQKDGRGWLKRCYLNRILGPEEFSELNKKIKKLGDLKPLSCTCRPIIGNPIKHKDGRLAFRLNRGNFKRTLNNSYK